MGLTAETMTALEGLTPEAKAELTAALTKLPKKRYNTLRDSPADAKYKLAVVQFKVKDVKNGGSDKGPDGNRVDSIPIANSVIEAGGSCVMLLVDADDRPGFETASAGFDALIVRINPGQLSQGTPDGTQKWFDGARRASASL